MLPLPQGMRSKTKNPYQSPPFDPNPPMMGTMGGDGTGEYPLGTGGPRVDPSSPNYVPPGTAGIKPMRPIKQPPMMPSPMPPMGGSDDLFGAPGAGAYDNLMSRSFQEYSSGQSPYEGASNFLMNRPAFDRGARPESSMPSTSMPSFSYSDPGGAGGLAQLQAQQPGIQAQYDQFAQQIQSAQEAAQQQAQQQTDMAASERQALMDRISQLEQQADPFTQRLSQLEEQRTPIAERLATLEAQEGPDLDAFGRALRAEILAELPEDIDIDALRRELTGDVLSIAQQQFPDVAEIREEVMSLLPEPEQIDVENLRRQIQESIDAGAPPEEIEALRQELQNRIRPVEEQLATIQDERPDIARQLGELRGELGALPDIDVNELRAQIISQLPEQERVDIEALQRQIQEGLDSGMSSEQLSTLREELQNRLRPVEEQIQSIQDERPDITRQIGELRGQLGALPDIDVDQIRQSIINQLPEQERVDIEALQRRIQESIDTGAPEQEIAGLRLELEQRLTPVEERVNSVRESVAQFRQQFDPSSISEQIGNLRGRLEGLPNIDIEDIRRRVAEGIEVNQPTGINPDAQRQIEELRRRVEEGRGRMDPDVLERLRAVEGRQGPDLSAIREQLGELRGRVQERPDVEQIAERVRGNLNPDLVQLREQIGQERGRDIEAVRGQINPLTERISQLRGRLDERPTIDQDAIERRIRESINIPEVDLGGIRQQIGELRGQIGRDRELPPEVLQRLRAVEQREGPDLSGITGQIAALENRGLPPEVLERLRAVEQRKGPDEAAIAERVRSGIDPRIADLQERFGRVDASNQGTAERLAALREQQIRQSEELSGQISPLAERIAALREQGERSTQERQTLEERLGGRLEEVRGQVSPLNERIAQLRGRLDERPTVDMDAIARRVRENINIPKVDLSGVQRQIAALEDRGLPPEVLERLRAVEQRKGPDLSNITEQIGQLRGRLDERPTIDQDALARRVRESIKIPQFDEAALTRRIKESIKVPTVDLGGIREQIGQLRGRLDERPQLTSDAVQRMIKESMANRTTAGIKPQPQVKPRVSAFPPGYRGGPR